MTLRSSLALPGAPVSVVFTVGTRAAWLRGTRVLYMSQTDRSAGQVIDAFCKEQRALMSTASAPGCRSVTKIQLAS